MLSLKNVRFEILRDPIVRDFSMDLQPGEVKTLFGPSGCGKTTVLRLISGLERQNRVKSRIHFVKRAFCFKKIVYWKISRLCRILPFLWMNQMNMKSLRWQKRLGFLRVI